jgi:Golgi apparatus protein 1
MVAMHVYGKRLALAAAVIAIVLAAVPSTAQITTPCNETITKYCKDVVPGSGRIMKCLNDHRDDQSIACKDWVEDQQKSMNELIAMCPEEIATLCKIDPPDKVRIYLCLLDNYIALKVDCRSKLGEIRDRLK